MNYEDCIKLLTSTAKFQIKLGLERVEKILGLLDNPQDKIKIIHIAGTNGKGSVCSILANILKYSGYKTGLYTSPHLIDYRERIQINGIKISKNNFASLTKEICAVAEKNNIYLTEFEILTVMAFKYFSDNNVDFAVIETGMGGRFDATNVCKNPVCSVITSISLDHTDRLGDTIEKIAFEKAGIIKKNTPTIISAFNKGFNVIANTADEKGAELVIIDKEADIEYINGENFVVINNKKYDFPLLGLYQKQNLALVLSVTDILKKNNYHISLSEGLKTVKWRARLEYNRKKNLLTDGAHNPDAAKELKNSLNYYFNKQKKIYIYATINTKDYKTIASILFNPDDEIYYYEFNHKNAVSYKEYKSEIDFLTNLHPYKKEILEKKELKILTGSFYMIGEFLKNNKIN